MVMWGIGLSRKFIVRPGRRQQGLVVKNSCPEEVCYHEYLGSTGEEPKGTWKICSGLHGKQDAGTHSGNVEGATIQELARKR